MATVDAVRSKNTVERVRDFYGEVVTELKKVTWPDWPQVRQLSIGVILLSLFIGAVIALMDVVFQQVLIQWIPAMFAR